MKVREAIENAKKDIIDVLDDLQNTLDFTTQQKSVFDKSRIIEMFTTGANTEEVSKVFPGFNTRQLGAIKAHVTMGTYK
jgi:molecular chaperone GrpE (heat shock protein)|tara:strand:- start:203 stop:439 length:237 start_codon:yes stop_codon:yes gene_type:complete